MAYHDYLTRIYNRRKFHELIESSLLKAGQENKIIALLVMDIDMLTPTS